MPRINASVGKGGKNETQDVAVIQLALYHIKVGTGSGRRRLYEGMIDGRPSPELFKAISIFQQCVGEPVTGRIQPFTPILSRFNRAGLPGSLIGMEGVKGTAAVFVPDTAPSEIETIARSEITRVELKAPLPKKLAASLSGVIRRINMKTKLYLVLKDVCITPQGRFEARLRFEMASFVSPLTRRLILGEPDYAPLEVIALVCQQVEDALGWNAGSDDNLTFRSTATYSSLTNRKEPSQAELKSIDLSQCPSDKLLKACVQGCIALANSGQTATPEHTDLITIATRINVSVGVKLQGAGSQVKRPKIVWPVSSPVVKSGFGRRPRPVAGASTFHDAIDFEAPIGEPIFATQDGTIFGIASNSRSGNHIFLLHDDGSMSSYSHTRSVGSLHQGKKVSAGDQIGESDGSGNISGPHLHYTYRPGTIKNPATPATSKVDPMATQFSGMSLASP